MLAINMLIPNLMVMLPLSSFNHEFEFWLVH